MKKIILTYGLIAGTIVGGLMLLTMPLWEKGLVNFDNGEVLGYSTMVISLSMVFFGIKSCRDNHYGGTITFGQGFKVGILITLIASLMYAMAWEISFGYFGDQFMQKMSDHYVEEMKNDGKAGAVLEAEEKKMAEWMEDYKNPLVRFPMTMMEILPVGLAITLISAGLLRKKRFLPVQS